MSKLYLIRSTTYFFVLLLLFSLASCKKDKVTSGSSAAIMATPTKLGLYEADSAQYKALYIDISKVGTQAITDYLVFDTGSGGMVIDAKDILPTSMVTSSGFNFTGDSTVVDGITITNQKSTVSYGDDDTFTDKVYGNLAYASVTIGNSQGNVVIKRLPFFLYYKAVDDDGHSYPQGYFNVFGVSPEHDLTFSNNVYLTSPFSYFDPGTGLTKGFKLAAIGTSNFSYDGTYVAGIVSLGLTSSDLSSSSFTMHQLTSYRNYGYIPYITSTINYKSKSLSTNVLFDTGTTGYSYIADKSATATTLLPLNSSVSLATSSSFNYAYTITANNNLTYVDPQTSTTVISSDFFLNNEYLLDYSSNRIGLKNN
ncbi:hypothetical protein HH214_00615 [Mucilaginibacter robiniae]|uniref:Peptidase A1 domain-containing protein n=1 Tax=Mucilaginibacter robiniae TaxID=2728022 RepID=A0A7L5DTN9_9SPHI|nr:hypothetical protein [Mucilaginibacter robiniae]QJD94475.1 hypothetical protein HH214_00615 [Mucilaginibacter robiniae]